MGAVRIDRDVVFASTDCGEVTADIYIPEGEAIHPAVLLIHGGAWKAGSKEMYGDWGTLLAQSGFVAMAINYRLSTETSATWPEVMDDVRSAYVWLILQSAKYNVDKMRIAAMGDSCGAHLSALLSFENFENSCLRAIVGVYGVYDLKRWWEYTRHTRHDDPVGRLMGGSPEQAEAKYKRASPSEVLEECGHQILEKSYFIIWADTDDIVPPEQSISFYKKLKDMNVNVQALEVPNYGHFWFTISRQYEGGTLQDHPNTYVAPQVLRFLKEKLG